MKKIHLISVAAVAAGLYLTSCNGQTTKNEGKPVVTDTASAATVNYGQIPTDAKKVKEKDGVIAYIQPISQDEIASVNAVWVTDAQGKCATKICTSDLNASTKYDLSKDAQPCKTKDIVAADDVEIVKDAQSGKVYLIISGVPDARNVYSYLVPVDFDGKQQKAYNEGSIDCLVIPAFEGFVAYDKSANILVFDDYGYHSEGGRYTYKKTFDFNGKLLSKGAPEEE